MSGVIQWDYFLGGSNNTNVWRIRVGATALGGWVCSCGLFGARKHISTRSGGVLVALQVPPQNRSSGTRGLAVAPPGMSEQPHSSHYSGQEPHTAETEEILRILTWRSRPRSSSCCKPFSPCGEDTWPGKSPETACRLDHTSGCPCVKGIRLGLAIVEH